MYLILPGFPKKSHANPEMIFVSFSYIYLVRIIQIAGLLIFSFTVASSFQGLGILIFQMFYPIYFVVVASYSIRSLTGTSLLYSVFIGFFLYFSTLGIDVLFSLNRF